MDVLVAMDFFTAEVWTKAGLVTCDVLFFIYLASRTVMPHTCAPLCEAEDERP